MSKGKKTSGHGMKIGGVHGSSRHLFGAAKGVKGPGAGEHTPGSIGHKAHTEPGGKHRRMGRGPSK